MAQERVAQKRHQVDLAYTASVFECSIRIRPLTRSTSRQSNFAELFGAKSRQNQCGDDCPAIGASEERITVELRGCLKQGFDLLGGIEIHRPSRRLAQLSPPALGRVAGDVTVFGGDRENPTQNLDRLVDR